jgi:hypothetical protein
VRLLINTGLFILFMLIVIAVIAFWKGGGPFKRAGEVTVSIGESIITFGDGVDDFIGSRR